MKSDDFEQLGEGGLSMTLLLWFGLQMLQRTIGRSSSFFDEW
jgi:hypothetical protein